MWFPDPSQSNTIVAFISDTITIVAMLVGQLSIWDLPKRILDTIGIVGVSISVITIIPIIYYFKKMGVTRSLLFWLCVFPIGLFISELDMNTYDYVMMALPFLTIATCLGLNMMVENLAIGKVMRYATLLFVVGFGLFNFNYFDLGRTLDKNMGASRIFHDEFDKIPDGAIFMSNYVWEWEAIFKYNMDYGKNIYPICIDVLDSKSYRDELERNGIKVLVGTHENDSIRTKEEAKSIIALNDNVWTSVSTDPSTFTSVVVPANHNTDLIVYDEKGMLETAANPTMKWIPDNPYDIITTRIMMTKWVNVLFSNYNVRFFGLLALLGYIINSLVFNRRMIGFSRKPKTV
jgi:hypothetical protein